MTRPCLRIPTRNYRNTNTAPSRARTTSPWTARARILTHISELSGARVARRHEQPLPSPRARPRAEHGRQLALLALPERLAGRRVHEREPTAPGRHEHHRGARLRARVRVDVRRVERVASATGRRVQAATRRRLLGAARPPRASWPPTACRRPARRAPGARTRRCRRAGPEVARDRAAGGPGESVDAARPRRRRRDELARAQRRAGREIGSPRGRARARGQRRRRAPRSRPPRAIAATASARARGARARRRGARRDRPRARPRPRRGTSAPSPSGERAASRRRRGARGAGGAPAAEAAPRAGLCRRGLGGRERDGPARATGRRVGARRRTRDRDRDTAARERSAAALASASEPRARRDRGREPHGEPQVAGVPRAAPRARRPRRSRRAPTSHPPPRRRAGSPAARGARSRPARAAAASCAFARLDAPPALLADRRGRVPSWRCAEAQHAQRLEVLDLEFDPVRVRHGAVPSAQTHPCRLLTSRT